MVKTTLIVLAVVLGLIVLVPASVVGYIYFTYKDDSVAEGEAYGFAIGTSKKEVFEAAIKLKSLGKIEQIHRWPENQSHKEFGASEFEQAMQDKNWVMVVDSSWWNNSIYLEFESNRLIKIRRFRLCCELP